jgi:Uncharacterized protein conserved in bacteria
MRKLLKGFILFVVIICVIAAAGFFYLKSRPLPAIEIGSLDPKNIRDGSYTGEYESSPVKAIVQVDVKGQKITDIKIIEHDCGLGKKAEKITDDIIKKQSLDVDTVSGATHSSKVILKAVENALEKGRE